MNLKARMLESWRSGVAGAVLCGGLGFLLAFFPRLGEGLAGLSYDYGFLLRPQADLSDGPKVQLVFMTEETLRHYRQSPENWDRALHGQLLDRFAADQARVVVFDIYFANKPNPGDAAFRRALRKNGRVVLAALEQKRSAPGFTVKTTIPSAPFMEDAAGWGIAVVHGDRRSIIRRYHPGNVHGASLPMAAVRVAGLAPTNAPHPADGRPHWLNYYGRAGSVIPSLSYEAVTNQQPGYFKDACVFIGGRREVDYLGTETNKTERNVDVYPTPFTRWGDDLCPGVEITATEFLNLARGDWLRRLPAVPEGCLTIGCGLFFGFLLGLFRPLPAVGLAVLGMMAVGFLSTVGLWDTRTWWAWMWVAGAQIPLGVAWTVLAQTKRLYRQKEVLEKVIESSLTAAGARTGQSVAGNRLDSPTTPAEPAKSKVTVQVPDHSLLRRVGRGAYGEVWLAQNAVGLYRAVKIVRKNEFSREGPYEREFNGIRNFMPVSLQHPRLLHLLHVGRNDAAGYFYAIMEVADDEQTGARINPDTYSPRTLAALLNQRQTLSPSECVPLVIALTDALGFLHQRGLIHRDIKPANIIFADGVPKLADIGLVTEAASTGRGVTLIGTAGYMAPEGPGTPAADLYSLGKVIYQSVFGRDPDLFPELPTGLDAQPEYALIQEFNRIVGKACQTDPQRRYQAAEEIHAEMLRLQRQLLEKE